MQGGVSCIIYYKQTRTTVANAVCMHALLAGGGRLLRYTVQCPSACPRRQLSTACYVYLHSTTSASKRTSALWDWADAAQHHAARGSALPYLFPEPQVQSSGRPARGDEVQRHEAAISYVPNKQSSSYARISSRAALPLRRVVKAWLKTRDLDEQEDGLTCTSH